MERVNRAFSTSEFLAEKADWLHRWPVEQTMCPPFRERNAEDCKAGIAGKAVGYYPESMTSLSLKMPESVADRLAADARARQKPKSALVREFIERGLSGGTAKGPSFHALAKDKAARFRGPRDMATNPKHMEGFGR
jgi:hypothetical protein